MSVAETSFRNSPPRRLYLDLYGEISYESEEDEMQWRIFQSSEMARLRDISLSSTPSAFAPHGVALSRFQHSVAVSYLARRLVQCRPQLRPYRNTLIAAALCHDIGSPPFSHIAEIFSFALTGRTHEEETSRILRGNSGLGRLLRAYDVDPAECVQLIVGDPDHFLSPLIAGSLDLDNISNSQDLLRSLGYRDELFYHPLRLIEAFRLRDGRVVLDSAFLVEILGWAEARKRLYDLLYSEANLSAGAMLYRAVEFAFAQNILDQAFFRLSESEALIFLKREGPAETREILRAEYQWKHYIQALTISNREEDPRIQSLYDDWRARKDFTDRLASELGLRPRELCMYVGRDRGEKPIRLPFIGPRAAAAEALFSESQGSQRMSVFIAERALSALDRRRLEAVVVEAVADLPERRGAAHIFM